MCTPSAAGMRAWRPLLDEDQSQATLASIHEIKSALVSHFKSVDLSSNSNVCLAEGSAGIALFFAYLQASGLTPTKELGFDSLARGVEALAARPMTASLYNGFTGIAWAAQHITTLLNHTCDDIAGEIDLALETYLKHSPWVHDYDLTLGLVGLGVYSLERSKSPVAIRCLELIVERLSELAEPCGDGLRWHTPPHFLPPDQRKHYPQGYYNLGLAHGVP